MLKSTNAYRNEDEKGEPNVTVTAFYFDEPSEKFFVVTQKDSKKVQHLKNRNITSYCIDDPNPPYTGARGKGTVKFENIDFPRDNA
jgi:general stress protein 26